MDFPSDKWRAWRAAELAAQAVEQQVFELMRRQALGELVDDIDDEIAFARTLRKAVHPLFVEAMAEMDERVDGLDRRVRERLPHEVRPAGASVGQAAR